MVWFNALTRHLQPQAIQARERAQIRAMTDSTGHVEVFQMDGVAISNIERPRPYPATTHPTPPTTPTPSNAKNPIHNWTWSTVAASENSYRLMTAPSNTAVHESHTAVIYSLIKRAKLCSNCQRGRVASTQYLKNLTTCMKTRVKVSEVEKRG